MHTYTTYIYIKYIHTHRYIYSPDTAKYICQIYSTNIDGTSLHILGCFGVPYFITSHTSTQSILIRSN